MSRILAFLLPMHLVGYAFTDSVSGRSVYYFKERPTGRLVMANGRRSFFRVEVKK